MADDGGRREEDEISMVVKRLALYNERISP